MTDIASASAPAPVDRALEQNINEIGIPPRPQIIDRIEAETRKDEPDFKHLAHLISVDVSLSAGLIKTANSAMFGTRGTVRSIDEALVRLGLYATSRAIASISLRNAFPRSVQLDRFWNASAQIAALSAWLTPLIARHRVRPDDAYTYGLFRDCGIPVLLLRFPQYRQTLTQANDELILPFTAIEEQDLPTNHAMIGCLLAQNWWLPEEICLAIRHHHELRFSDSAGGQLPLISRYLIAISQTAEHLLQQVTKESHTCEWPKLGAECLQLLGLTQAEVANLYSEAAQVIHNVD